MPIRQSKPLAPPLADDKEELIDFAAILQDNFGQLFEAAHNHSIRTTAPTKNEGNVTDIILVELSGSFRIYAKFSSGWKFVILS